MVFDGKYTVGQTVVLKIGSRPPLRVEILECLMRRKKPHYKVNWEKVGWNAMLNTIAIPEKSLSR